MWVFFPSWHIFATSKVGTELTRFKLRGKLITKTVSTLTRKTTWRDCLHVTNYPPVWVLALLLSESLISSTPLQSATHFSDYFALIYTVQEIRAYSRGCHHGATLFTAVQHGFVTARFFFTNLFSWLPSSSTMVMVLAFGTWTSVRMLITGLSV